MRRTRVGLLAQKDWSSGVGSEIPSRRLVSPRAGISDHLSHTVQCEYHPNQIDQTITQENEDGDS